MPPLRTELVKRRHAYTGADVPWRLDHAEQGSTLMRYLRGGGIRAFSANGLQELADRRQTRFLIVAASIVLAWCLLFFI